MRNQIEFLEKTALIDFISSGFLTRLINEEDPAEIRRLISSFEKFKIEGNESLLNMSDQRLSLIKGNIKYAIGTVEAKIKEPSCIDEEIWSSLQKVLKKSLQEITEVSEK